jgi:hypothetical protein
VPEQLLTIVLNPLMLATIPNWRAFAYVGICVLTIAGSIEVGSSQVKTPAATTGKPTPIPATTKPSKTPAGKSAPASVPSGAVPATATDLANDTTIVPRQKVGAITPRTTYTDLVKIYGERRLAYKKVYESEGQTAYPATVITFAKARYLTVAWRDTRRTQPAYVIINDSRYRTASGIGLGTSLDRLRQILGEFKITGLYWDYGNTVVNLSPAMQKQYQGLTIHVDADRAAAARYPKQLRAVTGDRVTPAASDPAWKPLKMRVSGLIVSLSK